MALSFLLHSLARCTRAQCGIAPSGSGRDAEFGFGTCGTFLERTDPCAFLTPFALSAPTGGAHVDGLVAIR